MAPYKDWTVRFAKKIGDRFAYKFSMQYTEADDWRATSAQNYSRTTGTQLGQTIPGSRESDPNYDGVNFYGDETTSNLAGVGTAVSIADGILGSFGMSPIKWLSDNLVGLVPDDAFTGLGNMALGSKVSPSEPASPKPMAAGGITKGPLNALIGEAGAEAVIPLNEFYAKLKELIQPSQQPTHIYLDGMKLSAAMNVNGFKIQ